MNEQSLTLNVIREETAANVSYVKHLNQSALRSGEHQEFPIMPCGSCGAKTLCPGEVCCRLRLYDIIASQDQVVCRSLVVGLKSVHGGDDL